MDAGPDTGLSYNRPTPHHSPHEVRVHHLGSTRSSLKPDHLLHTPDTFVRTPLPGADGVEFIVHVARNWAPLSRK